MTNIEKLARWTLTLENSDKVFETIKKMTQIANGTYEGEVDPALALAVTVMTAAGRNAKKEPAPTGEE